MFTYGKFVDLFITNHGTLDYFFQSNLQILRLPRHSHSDNISHLKEKKVNIIQVTFFVDDT